MRDEGFGPRLRRVMYRSGMTQNEFARFVGISQTTMSYYLAGKSEPRWRMLRRIMRATGCTARDLLGGAE